MVESKMTIQLAYEKGRKEGELSGVIEERAAILAKMKELEITAKDQPDAEHKLWEWIKERGQG